MTAYLEITASPDGRILCYETDGLHEIHWCATDEPDVTAQLWRSANPERTLPRIDATVRVVDVPSRVLALQQAVVLINERMFELTGPGYKLLWNARKHLLAQLED